MRMFIIVCMGALLCGCATFDATQQTKDFHPFAVNADGSVPLIDLKGYGEDEDVCTASVLTHEHPLDVAGIALAGGEGATSSASATVVAGNPLVLAAGIVGNVSNEALAGLGLDAGEKKFMKSLCMRDLGKKRGTYNVIDPALKGSPQ